jgi:sodium-dependent dicarboxylate transporter 2/3/5
MVTGLLDNVVTIRSLSWTHDQLIARRMYLNLLLGPAAGCLVWVLPLSLAPAQQKTLAVVVFMVVYWITEPIEHGLTALIGCYLFWALHVTKFSVAFSGFVNSTPWFLFGGLLMGEAASRTGLAKRLGFLVMRKLGSSYSQLLFGFLILAFLLNFFVPSGLARLAVIAPTASGIITIFGLGKQSNAAKGLFLILTYAAGLFEVMIMSGASSILTRGIIEEQTGIQLLWSQWLVAFLPLTLITIFVSIPVIRWLFPTENNQLPGGSKYFQESLDKMGPWTADEKKALVWFVLAVGLWATDFLHHVNPAIIGLGVGLLLSLPKIGVLDRQAVKQINLFLIIFSAGALSMGRVLMETKTLTILSDHLAIWMEPLLSNSLSYATTLYLTGFCYHLILANRQSMLITSLPVLIQLLGAHGHNVIALALLWTFAGGGALFIHQSSIFVMGYSYGHFGAKDFLKTGVVFTFFEGVMLILLVEFYWPLIGLN